MEFITQKYPCTLCKHDTAQPLLTKQGFSIVKCTHCNFVYVNPRVNNEQLFNIYQHNYFQNKDYGYIGYEQEKKLRVKNFERWLKDAGPFIPQAKIINALDVGCAAGYCLDVMKSKDWKAEGLELDEEMCVELANTDHIVFRQTLENFVSTHQYQVITLFDVIEHIPDIDAAFKQLNNLLEAGGIVVMVTPDHNSLQRKLLGKKWFQYKPIEHIQYFTKESLTAFAGRNNFKLVHYSNCGQYSDANFLVNRLSYYHFAILSKAFNFFLKLLGLSNRFFYTDTGSMFAVFRKM